MAYFHKFIEAAESLPSFEKEIFLSELKKYDLALYERQLKCLREKKSPKPSLFQPVYIDSKEADSEEKKEGLFLLEHGKVGALILAGGQGTRLGFKGPKGLFPILDKSLFQILFEKVLKMQQNVHKNLKVAVMTSPHNHQETEKYLKEHHFFGLSPLDVDLFIQSELPLLNKEEKWFLEKPGKLATAPDGNGNALLFLFASGILQKWQKSGVEYINIIPIDNPLAEPFDVSLISHQKAMQSDLCIKAIKKENPEENLGVLALRDGKLHVIEYAELSNQEKMRREGERLYWETGYAGLFSIHVNLIEALFLDGIGLPWHIAEKKAWDSEKGEIDIYKFETFIFDLFPHAKKPEVIIAARRECFAPIKRPSDAKLAQKLMSNVI